MTPILGLNTVKDGINIRKIKLTWYQSICAPAALVFLSCISSMIASNFLF